MAVFGTETVGTNEEQFYTSYAYGALYNLPENGKVTSIHFYCQKDQGTHVTCGIYDSGRNLVATSAEGHAPDAYGWIELAVSPGVDLDAGNYYLAYQADGRTLYKNLTTSGTMQFEANTYPTFPTTITAWDGGATRIISIHAVYEVPATGMTNEMYILFES